MVDLTRNKDVDLLILDKLDDRSLFYFCENNKIDGYVNSLCNNDYFWMNRLRKNFGDVSKIQERTWKNLYLGLVYFLDKYGNTLNLEERYDKGEKLSLPFILEIARNNDWDILYYFIDKKGFKDIQVIIEGAAEAGNIFMLNHFLNDDYLETAIFHSAKGGHRELTNDLIKRALLGENSKEAYIEQLNGALFGAAAGGQEELVQYYISKGANEWSYGLEGAIRSENMRLADFFIDRMNTVDAAVVTAINGNLPLFKKIIRNVSKRDIQRIKEKFYENFNFINREIYNYFNNL